MTKECVIKYLFENPAIVGDYLDYKNCKCRKSLIDKLVEECGESIDGNKLLHNETFNGIFLNTIPLNDFKKVCGFCILYIVLLVIFFKTSICISSVFIYFHWYLKKIIFVLTLILILKQQFIKPINGKYQANQY